MLNVGCEMSVDLDCYHPKGLHCSCYNFFPQEYTLETECERPCKLYVCAFHNPNEGDALSLENFERSPQQIGGNTSSHNYLESR